jgi:hypothetical protein
MESIKVLVQFEGTKVEPLMFKSAGRVYKLKKVNLVYHFRQGERSIFRFYVSDEANSYQLRFEPDIMQWFLEEN